METVRATDVLPNASPESLNRIADDMEAAADLLRLLYDLRRHQRPIPASTAKRLTESLAPLGYELLALAGVEPTLPLLDPYTEVSHARTQSQA